MLYCVKREKELNLLELGHVSCYPWGGSYRPEMLFKIGYDEEYLYVHLRCYEENPVVTVTKKNGEVWNDSCMEFFVCASEDLSAGYLNFEVNAYPAMLLYYGLDRNERRAVEWDEKDFDLRVLKGEDDFGRAYWQLFYQIPYSLLKIYFPKFVMESGSKIRANLYQCGCNSQPKHYACWSPIDTDVCPSPSFHVPRFFGTMIFE